MNWVFENKIKLLMWKLTLGYKNKITILSQKGYGFNYHWYYDWKMHYNETIVNLMDKDEVSCFKLWSNCDRTKNHSNSVNTMGFRVSFFCLIVVNSRQLFACLCWKLFHSCYKKCMGRQPCGWWREWLHWIKVCVIDGVR